MRVLLHECARALRFLTGSTALSLATLLPNSLYAQPEALPQAEQENPAFKEAPRDTVLKFNPDGTRRPFAGDTIICHLSQECRLRDTIVTLTKALRSSPFAHKLGVLPSDSYHMTVLSGPNDQDRVRSGWPADIPIDTPIAECNRIIGERIANFRMHADMPIHIRVDQRRTLDPQRASALRIAPASESENAKLRTLRDRLADEVFRFRAKGHAAFEFHISLAYQMSPFTVEEQHQYQSIMEQQVPDVIAATPVIELGVPEFCTFDDMYRFETLALLRS